jgi:hypothetical protein
MSGARIGRLGVLLLAGLVWPPPAAAGEAAGVAGAAQGAAAAEGAAAVESAAEQRGAGFGAIFTAANQAYLDGRHREAMAGYRKLIEAGVVHPDLYYNMANACYRAGRVGLAVLFYEKALALAPDDEAAASNLEMVRRELIDRVVVDDEGAVGEPLWHGFLRGLDLGWLTGAFLALWWIVFAVLVARRLLLRGPARRLLFWINVPVISVALVLGVLLFSRIYIQERVHHGVIVAQTAALREGPGRSAAVQMEVHAGLKVRLLNEVDDHVRVRLANGVEGFVQQSKLGRI